jgi:tRNA 2-thiouridine synthesizing protein C
MAKSLLIISRQSPWSGPSAREALDIALAGGAFDLPLGMLFLDDGVFQLLPDQNARPVQQKDLTANLKALSMFGVEELFACSFSLEERGIEASSLYLEGLAVMQPQELTAVIDRYDQVITI